MGTSKKFWFSTDPQIVINNENDEEFTIVDLEFGWMMTKWWPNMKGHSFYIRPSFGLGGGSSRGLLGRSGLQVCRLVNKDTARKKNSRMAFLIDNPSA